MPHVTRHLFFNLICSGQLKDSFYAKLRKMGRKQSHSRNSEANSLKYPKIKKTVG